MNLLYFSLCPLPLVLPLGTTKKCLCLVYISLTRLKKTPNNHPTSCMHKTYSHVFYNYIKKPGLKGINRLKQRRALIRFWSDFAALWMDLKLYQLKPQMLFWFISEKERIKTGVFYKYISNARLSSGFVPKHYLLVARNVEF